MAAFKQFTVKRCMNKVLLIRIQWILLHFTLKSCPSMLTTIESQTRQDQKQTWKQFFPSRTISGCTVTPHYGTLNWKCEKGSDWWVVKVRGICGHSGEGV